MQKKIFVKVALPVYKKKNTTGRGQLGCDEATPTAGAETPLRAVGVAASGRAGRREKRIKRNGRGP